jgi:hypothetical protein
MTATETQITAPVGRVRRFTRRAAALLLALVASLLLVAMPQASADVTIAGIRFHTTVDCGTSFGVQTTNTNSDVLSYARAWIYDYDDQVWRVESSWHQVNQWSSFTVTDVTIDHAGFYYFYMEYAQWTTAGWQMNGEYITRYNQHSGFTTTRTSTCWYGG